MEQPGDGSPSRMVVSRMTTRLASRAPSSGLKRVGDAA